MSLVLDASMAVSWLFEGERTATSHRVLQQVIEHGAIVPSLWPLEVANVLRNAIRRGRCNEAYATASLSRLGRLLIVPDEETFAQAWTQTRRLSQQENLTVYDAAYLEVALRRGLALASCDTDLLAAAKRCQVAVLTA